MLLLPSCAREDVFSDYVVDPEIYVKEVTTENIITAPTTLPSGNTMDVQYPSDQMILLMVEDTPRSEAERVASEVGGTIVGQVPYIDFYQVGFDRALTQEELDAALATAEADPAVDGACYNFISRSMDVECPAWSDLQGMMEQERCPFQDIDYYNALTIFEAIRSHITLHPVRVAVIDTGVNQDNGEFDEVHLLNLDDPNQPTTDTDGHGTLVAGVIAADDDMNGVNGIASRFLGNNLRLLVGEHNSLSLANHVAGVRRAAGAGAAVVNMSFGFTPDMVSGRFSTAVTTWRRLFEENPDVLFVAAADNNSYEINTTNYTPGGFRLSNLITVGGTSLCRNQQKWVDSAHGPNVNIYAPSQGVPTVPLHSTTVVEYSNGNSVATPMVASLAAILKSIDPSLSPREIKEDYIQVYAFPVEEGLRSGRLALSLAIEQALIDLDPSVSNQVLDIIDHDINDLFDAPGQVINRLCGGFSYNVSGYGNFEYYEGDLELYPILGRISQFGWALLSKVPQDAFINFLCPEAVECIFELDKVYPIALGWDDVPGYVGMTYLYQPNLGVDAPIGLGASGGVFFESCRIDERNPLTNHPMRVSVTGDFSGVVNMVEPPGPEIIPSDFEGYFSITFIPPVLGIDDPAYEPLFQYLEENCEGGIPGY